MDQSELSGIGYQHHVRHGRSDAAQSYWGFHNCRGRIAASVVQPGGLLGANKYARLILSNNPGNREALALIMLTENRSSRPISQTSAFPTARPWALPTA